jgi:DNA-binding transcriptional LysR family regulator
MVQWTMREDQEDLSKLLPVLPILADLGVSGHVTATAEMLGIPQSTVSRALSRAAAVVGTPLVTRKGRGVQLTPAALALIPRINAALEQVQAGLAEARQEAGRSFGRVGLAFQHTFGEAVLPLLLQQFNREHPGVTFELQQGSRAFCLDTLESGGADLAIVAPPPAPSRAIGAEVLYSESLKLVVSTSHWLAGRDSARLEEVRGEGFVLLEPGYGMRKIVEDLCKAAGFRPRVAFQAQDAHTIRGLISAGLGVGVVPPAESVNPEPAHGPLQWRELALLPPAHRDIGLVWRNRADEPEQVARFKAMVLGEGKDLLLAASAARIPAPPA